MSARKKQEEKHLKTLKSMQQLEFNKKCFECDQRGPTYVDVTIGSFVCTSCGGILRGLNPPHRIKSVSMATFTPAEISFMESKGNEFCKNVYLGKYESSSKPRPDSKDHAKLKYFMEQKYEHKRWYVSPDQVKKLAKPDTNPAKTEAIKPLSTLLGNKAPQLKVETPKASQADSVLGDFGSTTPSTAVASQPPSSNAGFADFGNAFTSQSFDAFGDFTSGTATSSAANMSNQSGFADFSNFLTPTNTTSSSQPLQKPSQTTQKTTDKYADLADLFSNDSNPSSTDMWSGLGTTTNSSVFGANASGMYGTQSANSSNQNQGSVFGSTTQQQPSVFGNATQQQPSVYGNTTQQQPSLFGNATQQQPSVYGNTTQQQPSLFGNSTQQQPNAYGNTTQQQQSVYGNTTQQQPGLFGNATQQQSAFGNTMQQQPNIFANTTQQPTSVYGSQGMSAPFSTSLQTNITNQSSNAFGAQQPNNLFGNTIQSTSSPFSYTSSNMSTVGSFPMSQYNAQPVFGTAAPTSAFNSQAQQSFVSSGTSASNVPNPFMQTSYATSPQISAQNISNPFMAQQQEQKAFSQSTGTNPFMNALAPTQQSQMSTNPFF